MALAPLARAQDEVPPAIPPPPPQALSTPAPTGAAEPVFEGALEQYLADRNLKELLALHLLERLKASDGAEKMRLADRLGAIYVDLLERATSAAERDRWEALSQDLLRAVPEADSFELKLNLAKVRYLQAEELAERFRLQLATPEERQEAERTLRSLAVTFQEIGTRLYRRVETLERRESAGRDEDLGALRESLGEARRLRSLAMYYAGWAGYYTAFLSARPAIAEEALTHFGWLLNAANGRQASVERLPASLVRYEHVARAAIGCALCESLRGNDNTALRWLDAVESAEGVPPTIAAQLFARRLTVLAAAKRWADVDFQLRRRRQPDRTEPPAPLAVGEARLLAVLTLQALQDPGASAQARRAVQTLADTALTDLITLGEVRHVQDLVTRYGTLPLGGDGFIVQYIRGMQAYDRARAAHAQAGTSTDEPAAADEVKNLYREAGGLMQTAVAASDASRFPDERSNAALMHGLSAFYSADLVEAADRFEQAYRDAASAKRAEDALWLAIVSLDKAVEGGRPSLKERLGTLAALYLKTYPRSDRAAKLLLRQSLAGLVSEEKAAEILLAVEAQSPLYESARRHAATLLYSIYRRSRGQDRDFAALRFAEVSEDLLRIDRARAKTGTEAEAREASSQVVIRVRQLLDAVLGMTAPDLARADRAFEVLDAVAADGAVDFKKVQDELLYRRLQVAIARGRTEDINRHLDRLHALGGRFSDSADRLLYKRALAALPGAGQSAPAAREVVRHGLRVVDQFTRDGSALADPAVYSLYNAVADAAARVWELEKDETLRDTALRLDRALLQHGDAPAPVLRRHARLAESDGDIQGALDSWRTLLAGLSSTSPEWYEARLHSLRLLAAIDAPRAREAMGQFRVLHPDFGPPPWGDRLRELDRQLGPAAPAPPINGATPPPGGPPA
ncbi:MAG: hypothetical protein WD749_10100 [Phycisphaerales bacterium]